MGGGNNIQSAPGKQQQQPLQVPGGDRRSSSRNTGGQPGQVRQPQLPPLQGMEPKPRPAPELPDPEAQVSCLNSLNYLSTHPDAMRPNSVPCCCGRPIKMEGDSADWYTEIFDGTVRCVECSFCARCGTEGLLSCRRHVSIGGHILCYNCVKRYGHKKGCGSGQLPALRIVLNEKNKARRKPAGARKQRKEQSVEQPGSANNSLSYDRNASNWWQSARSPECRSLLRYRDYPRPLKYVKELDPKVNYIAYYSAGRTEFDCMICPTCKVTAKGKASYVVPSISLVYHRKCFLCLGCKSPLCTGVKRAGVQFVFCTCSPPLQWCTRSSCTRQRMEHHATYKCYLEPLHPGGRQQNDTRILSENSKHGKDKKSKKSADASSSEKPDDAVPKVNVNDTILMSASNSMCGLKPHQQYLKLSKPMRPTVKDGRLVLPSPSSVTPAPSVSSSMSPEFSTVVAAAPPNFTRSGRSSSWRKSQKP